MAEVPSTGDMSSIANPLYIYTQADKYASEDRAPSAASRARASEATAAGQRPSHESPIYQDELRRMTLKRKRDEPLDPALYESFNVTVWEQRLYVSIITSNRVTTVSEFVKRSDGRPGEVQATGQVRVGDIISQINGHRVAGLDSASVSGMIKSARRPLVIVFLRPRVDRQPQERASRSEGLAEDNARVEAAGIVERSHRLSAPTAASAAANAVHVTNARPTATSTQPAEATRLPAANALVPVQHQSVIDVTSSSYSEEQQQSQQLASGSHLVEAPPALVDAFSNPQFIQQPQVPQQRYPPQQQSQVYSANQYVQQPMQHNQGQAAYETPASRQALRARLALSQHRQAVMQNEWNFEYDRQRVRAMAGLPFVAPTRPVPQPNSANFTPYFAGVHAPTSHLRPQYQPPQAAHSQQFVDPTVMPVQCPQQPAQPARTRWTTTNGIIVGNFAPVGSGSNVYNDNNSLATAAPIRTMAPEFNNYNLSNVTDYRPTPASVPDPVQGMMPAHQYASSSHLQRSRPEDNQDYDSSATESSGPGFSTNESRFSVVEPAQERNEQQNVPGSGGALEVDDDGTESDEPPPDYQEDLIGRFELEDDLESGVAPPTISFTGKAAASFLSAKSDANQEVSSSFLSPNKPSFVTKLPDNIGNRYALAPPSQQQQQQVEPALATIAGVECVVVEVNRTRLYMTLGSLGTWIAVTSFVRGKNGEVGEIEESGKVFIGDTIFAINGYPVNQEASPTDIAHIVTSLPRPFKLYFQRATWDTLEGST